MYACVRVYSLYATEKKKKKNYRFYNDFLEILEQFDMHNSRNSSTLLFIIIFKDVELYINDFSDLTVHKLLSKRVMFTRVCNKIFFDQTLLQLIDGDIGKKRTCIHLRYLTICTACRFMDCRELKLHDHYCHAE